MKSKSFDVLTRHSVFDGSRQLAIVFGFIIQLSLVAGELVAPQTLFEEALSHSAQLNPALDLTKARGKLKELVEQTREALEVARKKSGMLSPEQSIDVLNQNLLVDRKVTYLSNVYWRDSLFTTALLDGRGNCMSTSLLYHLMAQELKLPVHLAFAPGHAFVRWDDGTTPMNIETTAGGKLYTDAEFMARFDLSKEDLRDGGFLQRLTPKLQRAALLSNWASVLFSLGQRKEAAELLNEALRDDPANFHFQLQKASCDFVEGRIESADAAFSALAARKDAGPWARSSAASSRAHFLTARGRFDEAILALANVVLIAPGDSKLGILGQLGELYRHQRRFDEAIDCHKLTVHYRPTESNYNDLGSALTEAHRDAAAIDAYKAALKLNPENFFTRVILAGLYERNGEKAKGRAFFAATKEPREHKNTWYCALVWYYANIKEPEKMLANMEAAFKLDASGRIYHYFVREPDLDPYRNTPAFIALMKLNAPAPQKQPANP